MGSAIFSWLNSIIKDSSNYTGLFEDDNSPINELNFSLLQNFPNPFNPTTNIRYKIPTEVHVTLKIYNLVGQEMATLVDEVKHPGINQVHFNGYQFGSGVYICKLTAGNYISSKKIVLLK